MWIMVPLVNKARLGDLAMGPYALMAMFGAGMFVSTFIFDLFLVNLPVAGEPIRELTAYFSGSLRKHGIGLADELLFTTGIIGVFHRAGRLSGWSPNRGFRRPPAYAVGQGRRPDRPLCAEYLAERVSAMPSPDDRWS